MPQKLSNSSLWSIIPNYFLENKMFEWSSDLVSYYIICTPTFTQCCMNKFKPTDKTDFVMMIKLSDIFTTSSCYIFNQTLNLISHTNGNQILKKLLWSKFVITQDDSFGIFHNEINNFLMVCCLSLSDYLRSHEVLLFHLETTLSIHQTKTSRLTNMQKIMKFCIISICNRLIYCIMYLVIICSRYKFDNSSIELINMIEIFF